MGADKAAFIRQVVSSRINRPDGTVETTRAEAVWTLAHRGYSRLPEEVVRPQRTVNGKEGTHSLPLSTYSAPGGLRQDPGRAAEFRAEAKIGRNGRSGSGGVVVAA